MAGNKGPSYVSEKHEFFSGKNPLDIKGTGGQIFDAEGGWDFIFKILKEKGIFAKLMKTKGLSIEAFTKNLESIKPPQVSSAITTQKFNQK